MIFPQDIATPQALEWEHDAAVGYPAFSRLGEPTGRGAIAREH